MKKIFVFIAVMIIAVNTYAQSNNDHFRYRNGKYEKAGSILDLFRSKPAVGSIVSSLPPSRQVLLIDGASIYYYNGAYYKECPQGYIVVADPTVTPGPVVSTPQVPAEQLLFEIPNYDGTYKTVTLTRKDGGYVGSQGEYYPGQPTVEQLTEYKAAMVQAKAEQQKKAEKESLQQKTSAEKSKGDSGMLALLILAGFLASLIWCAVYICKQAINLEFVFFLNWPDAIGTMLIMPVSIAIVMANPNLLPPRWAPLNTTFYLACAYNFFAAWFYNRRNITWWKIPLLGISRVEVGVILPVLLFFHAITGPKRVKGDDAGNAIREVAHGASVAAFAGGMGLLIKELVNGKRVAGDIINAKFKNVPEAKVVKQMPKIDVKVDGSSSNTKKCPYCAEEIQINAVRCKYCGEALTN